MRRLAGQAVVLITCCAFAGGCAGGCGAPKLVPWSGPRFSASHPAGWRVAQVDADTVLFDGTAPSGAWTFGRTLKIARTRSAGPGTTFTSGCGSHVCNATLVMSRGGYVLTIEDACATDACPDERTTEVEMGRLAAAVMDTIQSR